MSITTEKIIDKINQDSAIVKQYWTGATRQPISTFTDKTHKALDTFNATATNVQDNLTQTANQAVESLNQTKNQVSQSLSEKTVQGLNQITSTTDKAITTLDHLTANAKNTLIENTTQTLDTLTQEKTKTLTTINQATAQAKASLEDTVQKAENLSQAASDSLQNALNSMVKNWLDAHPVIAWLVGHPLISLAICLLSLFILLGLFQALTHLVKSAWLFVLSSPQKLLHVSLLGGLKFTQNSTRLLFERLILNKQTSQTVNSQQIFSDSSTQNNYRQRISQILHRLEVIREEQNQLSRELAEILQK